MKYEDGGNVVTFGVTTTADALNWTGTLVDWTAAALKDVNEIRLKSILHSWEADSFVAQATSIRVINASQSVVIAQGASVQAWTGAIDCEDVVCRRVDGNLTFVVWYGSTSGTFQRRLTAIVERV